MTLPVATQAGGGTSLPDARGHFGRYGGRFVPEALVAALDQLEAAYREAKADPAFQAEFAALLRDYAGAPSLLYDARRLSAQVGARVLLKREDLNHTGAHKVRNVLGQALLTKRMGKTRIIAETGAGQHGVASATAAAYLDLECVVYMGEVDTQRQALNVARMRMLGATVVPVTTGSRTLKDALNEALRDWVTNVDSTHYLIGSVVGPHPFPLVVREFQKVIGEETRRQVLEAEGRLPDAVVACVGGGSNAMGLFHRFIPDESVALIGCEAGGDGVDTGRHAAPLTAGEPGVLHGARSYLMQDEDGQTLDTHSISAGLDYPGVGPEHAWLRDQHRAQYRGVSDVDAMAALELLAKTEGILLSEGRTYALLYLNLLKKLQRVDTISWILVLIADAITGMLVCCVLLAGGMLMGVGGTDHDERIPLFTAAAHTDPELPYGPLLRYAFFL